MFIQSGSPSRRITSPGPNIFSRPFIVFMMPLIGVGVEILATMRPCGVAVLVGARSGTGRGGSPGNVRGGVGASGIFMRRDCSGAGDRDFRWLPALLGLADPQGLGSRVDTDAAYPGGGATPGGTMPPLRAVPYADRAVSVQSPIRPTFLGRRGAGRRPLLVLGRVGSGRTRG